MRSRLITLLLLAGLAWLLVDYARREDARTRPPPHGELLFPGLEAGSVTRFGLETRGGPEGGDWVEFEREPPGPWRIVFPAEELAESEYVEAALRQIVEAKALAMPDQGVDVELADLGLDPPRHAVKIVAAGQEYELFLGARDPLGKGAFALRGDSREPFMVSPGLLTAHEQFRPYDYVDKNVFRGYEGTPITGLRIEDADGVWLHARREGLGWRVLAPRAGRGDAGQLNAIVRSLQFMDQRSVHATDPGLETLRTLGLPTADERARGELSRSTLVALEPRDGEPLRIYLQDDWRDPQSQPVLLIREDGHKLLGVEPQTLSGIWNADRRSFLDPALFPPLGERAESLAVQLGDELLLDLRKGPRGDWAFRRPERLAGEPVETRVVDGRSSLGDLLQRVDALRATGFVDPPAGEPELVLRAGWETGGRVVTEQLEIFDVHAPQPRARLSSRPGEGFLLDHDAVHALLDPFLPDSLRSLAPVDLDPDAWAVQEIVLPGLEEPLRLERATDAAGVTRVLGDDPRGERLGLGLDVLRSLRGVRWEPLPEPAPDYPWALRWLDAEGALLARLELRHPAASEAQEAFGRPVVRARWSGVPGAELLLPADVLERFEALREGG